MTEKHDYAKLYWVERERNAKNFQAAQAWKARCEEWRTAAEDCREARTAEQERAQGLIEDLKQRVRDLQEPPPVQPPVDPPPTDPPVDPPPTPPAQDSAWWRALDRVNKTPAENKQLLAQKLAQRAPRPERIHAGKTWRAHEAEDCRGLDFRAQWQWALNVILNDDPNVKAGNLDLVECTVGPGTPAVDGDFDARVKMKWGARRYDLGDITVVDCDFFDIPKEHGLYDSLGGHGLYRGCTFKDIGSQAIQMAYRDAPYSQYGADNDPLTKSPIIFIEDCHAVDTGNQGSRPSFAYTLFDPGTREHPGIVVVKDSSYVSHWATPRSYNGQALRSTGGLVVHQFQQVGDGETATSDVVITNCLFDATAGDRPVASIRGVERILLHDSCFIARNHRQPHVEIDGEAMANSSGRVVIQNCVSPGAATMFLRVNGRNVTSLHCPDERIEVDVESGRIVSRGPVRDEPMTRLLHPLRNRPDTVPVGFSRQKPGHIDDLPNAPLEFAPRGT